MVRQGMEARIERILGMQRPGSGLLTRAAWVVILAVTVPVLYTSVAVHAATHQPAQELVSPLTTLAWFPQVGSHWIYEHEAKSGDRNRPDVDRWRTEQTITGWVTIPEGLVVLREVKELGSSPQRTERVIEGDGRVGFVQEPEWNRKIRTDGDRQPYLVRRNCLYGISGGWDTQTQQLRPQYRKYLIEGHVSPDFCFPLRTGQEWGDPHGYTVWRVEPARDNVGSVLPSEYAGAIHIFSDNIGGPPGASGDVWFQKGVGVVAEHYSHNGTYDEYTKKLVSH